MNRSERETPVEGGVGIERVADGAPDGRQGSTRGGMEIQNRWVVGACKARCPVHGGHSASVKYGTIQHP